MCVSGCLCSQGNERTKPKRGGWKSVSAEEQKPKENLVAGRGKSIYSKKLVIVVVTTLHG